MESENEDMELNEDIIDRLNSLINESMANIRNKKNPEDIQDAIEKMREKVYKRFGPEGLESADKILIEDMKEMPNTVYKSISERVINENPIENIKKSVSFEPKKSSGLGSSLAKDDIIKCILILKMEMKNLVLKF